MLERLTVRNYKSLEEMTLKLRPLNIFVGPNNAGKSNILDCLQFLSDFIRQGQQGAGAVHSRGGFKDLVWGGDLKRTISFQLEGKLAVGAYEITQGGDFRPTISVAGPVRAYKYVLELAGGPTHYSVIKELFALKRDAKEQKFLEFPTKNGTAQLWDTAGKPAGTLGVRDDTSKVGEASTYLQRYPEISFFVSEISDWGFYKLVPSRMRSPLPVKKDLRLQPEGENLPVILHSLQTEHRNSFKQIVEALQSGVPELRELFTALTEQGSTYLSIEEQGLDQRIPAWAMSDGTLQLLAHLAVIYSPSPPALVCFEEPENFLHPHLLQLLAELLQNASERTQILVTTHSPYLLNFMDPADLIIVEKSEGKTKVRPAHKKKGLKEALRVLGLGEMWYAGSLGGIPK